MSERRAEKTEAKLTFLAAEIRKATCPTECGSCLRCRLETVLKAIDVPEKVEWPRDRYGLPIIAPEPRCKRCGYAEGAAEHQAHLGAGFHAFVPPRRSR